METAAEIQQIANRIESGKCPWSGCVSDPDTWCEDYDDNGNYEPVMACRYHASLVHNA